MSAPKFETDTITSFNPTVAGLIGFSTAETPASSCKGVNSSAPISTFAPAGRASPSISTSTPAVLSPKLLSAGANK